MNHSAQHPTLAFATDRQGILFGGDYNPDQWPEEVWDQDIALMKQAKVNLVTVGVFSWARLEPREDQFNLGWLGELLDLLYDAGISVDLATPTASPPPWLGNDYPETQPVMADGVRLTYGSRNQFSPSSKKYRERARSITRAIVERFHDHPAIVLWHVGNELGQVDYGPEAAREYRKWLKARYGTIENLNEVWATSVWSQRYDSFDEVIPPRDAPYHRNPAAELDFRRFTSDELLSLYRTQAEIIREYDRERPITTNFMGFFHLADYQSWAGDIDVISDDAYPDPADERSLADAALVQAFMRSLGGGAPWLLMESASSAVSWRPHNLTKSPARSRLESLQAVANGADGICFFQWRGAKSGPERYHSAMLPVQGPDTAVHAGVRRLGADLSKLASVAGQRSTAKVALIWDWASWWAATGQAMPTNQLDPLATLQTWHRALWDRRVPVDLVPAPQSAADLAYYDLVLAPSLHILTARTAISLREYVADGGTLAFGPFSGVSDENTDLQLGRFPAMLRDVLGVSGEEWVPLPPGGVPATWVGETTGGQTVEHYAEHTRSEGAEVRLSLTARPGADQLEGAVAVSRNQFRGGTGWYVGATLDPLLLSRVLGEVLDDAGVSGLLPELPVGVEVTNRGNHLFILNHLKNAVEVPLDGPEGAEELLSGKTYCAGQSLVLPSQDVAVLRLFP